MRAASSGAPSWGVKVAAIYPPAIMIHEPLVIIDFETTGLRPETGDRVTEVGLVRIENGHITDRFQSLANADMRVPRSIVAYTGITQEMVDTAPPVADVMRQAAAFIGETTVVAHNAGIDQRFYVRECRHGRIGVVVEPFLCSMRLARRVYPQLANHSLAELAYRLGLPRNGTAHRAAVDAELTAQLMLRIIHDIHARRDGLAVTAKLLRQIMRTPVTQVEERLEQLSAA